MKEVIKNLKLIISKYKTSLEVKRPFRFSDDDLETLRKAIRYLELVNALTIEYNGDKYD